MPVSTATKFLIAAPFIAAFSLMTWYSYTQAEAKYLERMVDRTMARYNVRAMEGNDGR